MRLDRDRGTIGPLKEGRREDVTKTTMPNPASAGLTDHSGRRRPSGIWGAGLNAHAWYMRADLLAEEHRADAVDLSIATSTQVPAGVR